MNKLLITLLAILILGGCQPLPDGYCKLKAHKACGSNNVKSVEQWGIFQNCFFECEDYSLIKPTPFEKCKDECNVGFADYTKGERECTKMCLTNQ